MLIKRTKNIIFIVLMNFNVCCYLCSDSLHFVKWISLKFSSMPFIHQYYFYEITKSNSQTVLFEFAFRQRRNLYSLSTGLGRYMFAIKFPDYSKITHHNFSIIDMNERNQLYSILGERNLNLTYIGIPVSLTYYRQYKRFLIGISTGVIINRLFDFKSSGLIIRYPDTLSYQFVGVLINKRFSRTYTEIKFRYNFLSRLSLELCFDGNLFSLLIPPKRSDFINYYYDPPPRSFPGSWNQFGNNGGIHYSEIYNIELLFNRIQLNNLSVKLNFNL